MNLKTLFKVIILAVFLGAVFFVLELVFRKPLVEAPSMRLPTSLPKISPPNEPPPQF